MMQILSCHHSDGRRDPGPNPRQQAWMWVGCCLTVVTRHLLESDDQQASLPAGQSSGSWGPTKDPHSVTKWESTLRVWKKNVPPPTHIFSLRSLWTVSTDPEKPTVMITCQVLDCSKGHRAERHPEARLQECPHSLLCLYSFISVMSLKWNSWLNGSHFIKSSGDTLKISDSWHPQNRLGQITRRLRRFSLRMLKENIGICFFLITSSFGCDEC